MRILGSGIPQPEKTSRRTCVLVCVLLCCSLIAGCHHPRGGVWAYRASTYPISPEGPVDKTIVFLAFKDSRPYKNRSKLFGSLGPLRLLPLIPNGWADYSRPESPKVVKLEAVLLYGPSRTRWQFSPGQDFALAIIEELQASGLLHEITLAERATEADLILHVELKSTRYTAKEYWYGLGLLCAPLLYLGAPMGTATNELDMEFVLEERASGQRLWHKRYYETRDATFFFYWSPPDFHYDELLNTILQDVVKNLRASLSTRMSALPHGDDGSPLSLTSDGVPSLLPDKATVRVQEGACNEAGLIGRLQTGSASSWRLRECNGTG